MRRRRTAVLGAGALGLTVALRLAERGERVDVFEREAVPGGLAAGFKLGDVYLEKFYHHLFRTDRDAIELIQELDMEADLVWSKPKTVVLSQGQLWPLDSARSVLRFHPLTLANRVRMGAGVGYLRALPRADSLEGRTASGWIKTWMGKEAYRVVWEPLLESKFGESQDRIAMPWFWARIHYRTASLGYLRGGFQRMYEAQAERIRSCKSEIHLGAEVRQVRPAGNLLEVECDKGSDRFDQVISTLPAPITSRLANLPSSYSERFGNVETLGALCLVLALDRKLTDAYWINVNDPGYPFQPLVEHTNFVDPEAYEGRHIVYLGKYLRMDSELFRAPKEEVLNRFLPAVKRIRGEFDATWVTGSWLFRAGFAQPIVTPQYAADIPPFETPIPGLFMANMFQVYPQDRGQNYSIRLANRLVRERL